MKSWHLGVGVLLGSGVLMLGAAALAQTSTKTSVEGITETVIDNGGKSDESDTGAANPALTPAVDGQPLSAQTGNITLRDTDERITQLKEKIFRSKARLLQLQEMALHSSVSGASSILVHRNEMGSSFILRRVQYALDGVSIFMRIDETGKKLNDQEEFEVFSGRIAPGIHRISAYIEYQGYGYGVFSYLTAYRFRLKSSCNFTAEEGRLTTVKIVGYEKGGLTTILKDRLAVRFDIENSEAPRPLTSAETTDGTGPAAGEQVKP